MAAAGFDAAATQNAVLLDVTTRYLALVEAEAHVQAIRQSEAEYQQIADLTADFARTGQGRQADADRAKADALLLHTTEQRAEEDEAVAAAELARLLSRDPAVRLHTPGGPVPMVPLVDPRLDLETLVRIAVDNRPETAARTADVALNEARLREERFRPLLPVVSVGYSAGQFGGGSDTTDPTFGGFGGRTDFDAYAFWSLENLGVGNWAHERRRRAEVNEAQSERIATIDRIRREVADAYAASAARLREVDTAGRRLATAQKAFEEGLETGQQPGRVSDRGARRPPLAGQGSPGSRSAPLSAMMRRNSSSSSPWAVRRLWRAYTETKCRPSPPCGERGGVSPLMLPAVADRMRNQGADAPRSPE